MEADNPDRVLPRPSNCPECKTVAMKVKGVRQDLFADGGIVDWECPTCGLHNVQPLEFATP